MVHRCVEHHTPIGLAAVPIRVFLRDVRPPPGFSIADFNDRIVDTISSTNPSSEKKHRAAMKERRYILASLGFSASNSYRLFLSAPLCTTSLNVALFLLDC